MKDIQIYHKSINENLVNKILLKNRDFDIFKTVSFINSLYSCLNSEAYSDLDNLYPIVLALDYSSIGETQFLVQEIFTKLIQEGTFQDVIALIDIQGNLVENIDVQIENYIECLNYSICNEYIVFYILGNELYVSQQGQPIEYIANTITGSRAASIKKRKTSIENYKKLINKHFVQDIKTEKFIFWENRQNYILINKPEQHFKRHLYNFLKENIVDAVTEEMQIEGTTDRVDIGVTTPKGAFYLFEIKWIGKSNGTNFDGETAIQKLNEGVFQLNEYLKNSNKSIKGALIVYDARKDKTNIEIYSEFSLSKKLDKEPLMVELNPNSASKMAIIEVAKIVRAKKQNKKYN